MCGEGWGCGIACDCNYIRVNEQFNVVHFPFVGHNCMMISFSES